MYQVRWGADYLMKMVGSGTGTNAGNLEIIYQVHLLLLLSASHMQYVGLFWKGCWQILCALCQRHAAVCGSAMLPGCQ